ncbi:hypothetical protein [Celerinatantimonas sp. YJH-8]|uniref:hypothetical protein n=1 Tax=Celerinatantimonas sp. YJH-8 TaxID=3228714 RepID=UPI0038BFCDDA
MFIKHRVLWCVSALDFKEVVKSVRVTLGFKFSWKEYLVLAFVPLLFVAGILYIVNTPARYQADAIVSYVQSPLAQIQAGSLRHVNPVIRRSILRSLRQQRLSQLSNQQLIVKTLRSYIFLGSFIEHYQLKPVVFPKRWDGVQQRWIRLKPGVLGQLIRLVRPAPENASPQIKEPTAQQAARKLRGAIRLKPLPDAGGMQISLIWQDAQLSQKIVNQLIDYLNVYMVEQTRAQIQQELVRYQQMVDDEKNITVRQFLMDSQQQALGNLLLQNVQMAPSLQLLDPAVTPVSRYFRVPVLITGIVWVFFSGVTFCLIVLRRALKEYSSIPKKTKGSL